MKLPRNVVINRRDLCADCPTPCALQREATAHADPCAACELGRWGTHDCQPLGDRAADAIEQHVLAPLEQALPTVAPVLAAVRRCGGCTHAKHQLGSSAEHPDPGVVV